MDIGPWKNKCIQKSFFLAFCPKLNTGSMVHNTRTPIEIQRPRWVPKNCLNTAPVYPNKAEMSNLSRISVRDRSMGFNMEATNEKVSKGYSSKRISDI